MKALGMGMSFHAGPTGEPGKGPHSQAFERRVKVCFGDGASLSMGALKREPGGGLIYWAF
jgi:hypothetical protein